MMNQWSFVISTSWGLIVEYGFDIDLEYWVTESPQHCKIRMLWHLSLLWNKHFFSSTAYSTSLNIHIVSFSTLILNASLSTLHFCVKIHWLVRFEHLILNILDSSVHSCCPKELLSAVNTSSQQHPHGHIGSLCQCLLNLLTCWPHQLDSTSGTSPLKERSSQTASSWTLKELSLIT